MTKQFGLSKGKILLGAMLLVCLNGVQASHNANMYGNISMTGSPDNVSLAKGFGRDVELISALKSLTPDGWVVKKVDPNNKVDINKKVSWKGGQPWVDVLNQLSYQGLFTANVDWVKKEITLAPDDYMFNEKARAPIQKDRVKPSNQDMYVPPTLRKVEYEIPHNARLVSDTTVIFDSNGRIIARERDYGVSPQRGESNIVRHNHVAVEPIVEQKFERKVEKTEETAIFEVSEVLAATDNVVIDNERGGSYQARDGSVTGTLWVLDPERSLKANVTEWGKLVGYKVVWNGADYPIDESRSLFGSFESGNGPIMQLSVDYGPDSSVKSPLSFKLYKNKTLVVEDLRYEQGGSYSGDY